jgi:hypothetical protein
MLRQVDRRDTRRPAPSTSNNRPTPDAADVAADVLARVYALILSWPTAQEKQERQEGSNPT